MPKRIDKEKAELEEVQVAGLGGVPVLVPPEAPAAKPQVPPVPVAHQIAGVALRWQKWQAPPAAEDENLKP